ncbi:hypothetical protein B0H11DRAFT_1911194 [Mycena galericulata]|nr:hypothetical protein B0H11DRAFT_1911194 [Mycena galericulata]
MSVVAKPVLLLDWGRAFVSRGWGAGCEKGKRTGKGERTHGGDADVRSGGGEELDKGAGVGFGFAGEELDDRDVGGAVRIWMREGRDGRDGKELARTEGNTGEEDDEDGAPEVFREIPDAPGKEERRRDEHLFHKMWPHYKGSGRRKNRIYAQDIHLAFHTVGRDISTQKKSGKGSVIRVQEVRNEGDGTVATGMNAQGERHTIKQLCNARSSTEGLNYMETRNCGT